MCVCLEITYEVRHGICLTESSFLFYSSSFTLPLHLPRRPITSTTPRTPDVLLNLQTTTPLPLLMSTSSSDTLFAKPKSSVADNAADSSQQQPSTVWFKLNHDRSLVDSGAADVDADLEADVEEHDDADSDTDFEEHEHESEHEHEQEGGEASNEHARELSDGDEVKEHVFPLNDNELHNEMHSIEELQLQLQSHANDDQQEHETHEEEAPEAEEVGSAEHEADAKPETETDWHFDTVGQVSDGPAALPSSTEAPAIEVRLKQIAQDFEKMTSSQEQAQRTAALSKDEITPQSSLSLSDLIRTLRPNEQQIIPQIDSDYSNAMRVLGKTSAVVNNEDSRKFKVLPEPHSF